MREKSIIKQEGYMGVTAQNEVTVGCGDGIDTGYGEGVDTGWGDGNFIGGPTKS